MTTDFRTDPVVMNLMAQVTSPLYTPLSRQFSILSIDDHALFIGVLPIDTTPATFISVEGNNPFDYHGGEYDGVVTLVSAADGDEWILTKVDYLSFSRSEGGQASCTFTKSISVTYAKSSNGQPPKKIKTYYKEEEHTDDESYPQIRGESEWGRSYMKTNGRSPLSETVKSSWAHRTRLGYLTKFEHAVIRKNILSEITPDDGSLGSDKSVRMATGFRNEGTLQSGAQLVGSYALQIPSTSYIDFAEGFWEKAPSEACIGGEGLGETGAG